MVTPPWLLSKIRAVVWIFSFVWVAAVFTFLLATIPPSPSRAIMLSRTFADTAGVYLYLTLLIGPLSFHFRSSAWAAVAIKARRAVGVSVLLFALLHSGAAFWYQLGGFAGLSYLSSRYLLAMALGANALLLLGLLTVTSPDRVVTWLGNRLWKVIHRFVYLIGILIFFHIVLLGSRFANLHSWVAVLSFFAVTVLWLLECNRADAALGKRWQKISRLRPSLLAGCLLSVAVGVFMIRNAVNPYSLSGHDGHYEFENRVGLDGVHHDSEK